MACFSASAQNRILTGADAKALVKGSDKIIINSKRNTSSFIHLAADRFVPAQNQVLWLRSALGLKSGDGLKPYKTEIDNIGYTHYRYHQTYMSVPVQYGVYYVHTLKGRIVSANGEWYNNINLSTQPKLTPKEAYGAAVSYVHADAFQHEQEDKENNELVILPYEGRYYLAYRCDVFASKPMSREWYFIDANTGSLIKADNRICNDIAYGTASTQYSGTRTIVTDSISPSSFRLHDVTRGNGVITYAGPSGTTDYYDANNIWNTDQPPVDCHFGAEATYDYYWNHFGQNGLDGSGFNLVSYAHDGLYVNAFWNGSDAHFGDGGGGYGPLTDAAIVGHEFTHGVTEFHSGLIYSCESGGLNEGFSDVFGQAIDWENNPSTASWFVTGHNTGTPFRNMADPKEFYCPDTYGGEYWSSCGEVHSISGVLNHWYYLLVEGGSNTNDLGNSYTVLGIGFDDATAVAYRDNAYYLTPNSTYEDAKDYGIQSAIDLFGNCSDQVIQTTNAWYAVGLGDVFSDAVVASFSVPSNYFCVVPATVSFTNNSINGTSYLWDFGDGATSTVVNPAHTYDTAGIYTVTLIVDGTAACGNQDTLTMVNFISVTDGGGPISASCTPSTITYCCGVGITHVQFGDINKTSGNGSEGYKDFTCSNSTTLTAGDPVAIHITTGSTTYENVRVFIDYDNNGVLNPTNESVFTSSNLLMNHTGLVYTPATAVLNTALRMRVMDDGSSYTISSACYNPQYGQAEDYTINFIANTLPPVADFTANLTTVNVGSSVSFNDLTIHAPTSWAWSFPGGTPSSSTQQNPSVTYNATGTYDVQLIASNSFGSDTILKTAYISVVSSVNMCVTTTSAAPNGILYDSGGPTGNYQDNESCTLLLSPPCADTIVLAFSAFSSESCCDHLAVYDGTNSLGLLLLYTSGYSIPAPVKASSGNMFITWYSDVSVISSGYAATWSTIQYSTIPPVADFAINDTTPPLNVSIQFTDASLNSPNAWIWDFGDGYASTLQNPAHAFAAAGTYAVTLIAFTCTNSDTITKTVVVQSAPDISTSPDSVNVILSCGEVASFPIIFSNSGAGDLVAQLQSISSGEPLEVLALTYGTDLSTEYPNTISAINTYFTNYNLTTINTTSGTALADALDGKNVFLMTEPETGSPSVYSGFATALQDFISNGGLAILCGAYGTQSACNFNTGLFSGSYYTDATSQALTISNSLHPIMQGVTGFLSGTDGTYAYDITNGDKNQLVTYSGKDIVTTRQIGSGNVVYIAFDYYSSSNNTKRIVSNAVKWGEEVGQGQLPDWLTVDPDSILVNAGGSDTAWVTFSTIGLDAGNYSYDLIWATNDPSHPFDTIPVTMSVSGPAVIQLSDACLSYPLIMQYTSSYDSVLVVNQGCDSLHCTGMSSSIPEFHLLSGSNLTLAPHDSAFIKVEFHPTTAGTFSGFLTIPNNDNDTTICLNGSAFPAPAYSVSPDSINVFLSCGDMETYPVVIYNSGLSDLSAAVSGTPIGGGQLKVLALTYGTDLFEEYPQTIAAINAYFTDYSLTTVNTTSGTVLTDSLVGKNVFLMTEPENGSPSVYLNFATPLQNFVSNGGLAVICGAYAGQNACIYNTGLFSGNYYDYTNSAVLTILNPAHPILENVNPPLLGANATYLQNLTNPDIESLVTYLGYDVVAVRPIGAGYAVYVGYDYYDYNTNSQKIIANAIKWGEQTSPVLPDWADVDPDSVTVSPAGNDTIWVTLNTSGLNAGTYSFDMIVTTNDPLNPVDTIPVSMTISGPAVIQLGETCLNYPITMQYATSEDSVLVTNNGCDTLHCAGMSCSIAEFTITSGVNLVVAPHDSAYIKVQFNPATAGTFSGWLIIPNNDIDTLVCLNGSSFLAPNIEIVPSSIDVTITTCSDSITVPVQIINSGGSQLDYSIISGTGIEGPLKVLALTYGTDVNTEYPNTISAINQYFTDYTLTTIGTTSSSALQSALIDQDIFLMTEPEIGAPSVYSGFSDVLQDFVGGGGGAVLCGASGTQSTCITNTGLFSGSYAEDANGLPVSVVNNTHPITQGVSSTFNGTDGTYVLNISNGNNNPLVEYNGDDVVSYRNIGNGTAVFLAFDYFSSNTNTQKLIANSFSWLKSLKGVKWINVSSDSGIVNTGDTTTIFVTISRGDLANGTYTTNIIVATNDPLHPFDTIPVTLNIESPPCTNFSYVEADCNGAVCFNDSTISATSWNWNFGDGLTSALENPCHTYSTTGSFTIKLVTCNAYGCDSTTQAVNINSLGGPIPASCSPGTDFYCCGIGISNVSFNTINQSSGDGVEGYEDFSCGAQTTVNSGDQYTISVTTGTSYSENVRAWIDWNNNGSFSGSELVFTSNNNLTYHSGTIIIPLNATLNVPLRMRVGSDYFDSPAPSSCANADYGQFEDYSVLVTVNELPTAAYNYSANICTGVVSFFDNSTNAPTSWHWSFGDGQTSTLQNPTHTYILAGTYTSTLIACNLSGCDTFLQPVTVSMLNAAISYTGLMQEDEQISFTGIANGANSWQWTFGDGGFSNLQSPVHTYTAAGTYIVTLLAGNSAGCSATVTDTLDIFPTSIDETSLTAGLTVFPNPFYSGTFILLNLESGQKVTLKAFDLTGRLVKTFLDDEMLTAGEHQFEFIPAGQGVYFIEFKCVSNDVMRKVLKVK